MLRLLHVTNREQLAELRVLFQEYADSLSFDLGFQNFQQELAELPGEYAPPQGRMLLAVTESGVAGCVALRQIGEDVCEMKRLYVRPQYRSRRIGRDLALAIVAEARRIGYRRMRLDTVPRMAEAIALYRSLGFQDTDPYRYNPIEGAIFMELDLSGERR